MPNYVSKIDDDDDDDGGDDDGHDDGDDDIDGDGIDGDGIDGDGIDGDGIHGDDIDGIDGIDGDGIDGDDVDGDDGDGEFKSNKVETVEGDENFSGEECFTFQSEGLVANLRINFPFYVITILCFYVLARKSTNSYSFLGMSLSLIFVAFNGYFIHVLSHAINLTEMYNNSGIYFKRIPILDSILKRLVWFVDFHRTTHHNSEVNKEIHNQIFEAFNNFVMQGVASVIISKFYSSIDYRLFVFWGLFYASVHIINYSFVEPTVHKDHHTLVTSNYGVDIFDILMGTKYDWNDIENYNHYSINMILLSCIYYCCI